MDCYLNSLSAALHRYLKLYAPLLSQNHYHMCEMKGVLAQRIGGDNPQHLRAISQAQLMRKICLYKEILQVYQAIAPGVFKLRHFDGNSLNYHLLFQWRTVTLELYDSIFMPPLLNVHGGILIVRILWRSLLYASKNVSGCSATNLFCYPRARFVNRLRPTCTL